MPPRENTAKAMMLAIIQDQPEDSSYEGILRELAFKRLVDRGLADAAAGRTLGTENLRRRIKAWTP